MGLAGLALSSHCLDSSTKAKKSVPSCSLSPLLFTSHPMDPLSTSVSTFKASPLTPTTTNREISYHFKRAPYATLTHVSSTSIPNMVPKTKAPPFSHKCSSTSLPFTPTKASPLKPSSPIFHYKPSTGYAAAIIDVAQSTNSLHLVQKDVQRLLKFLQHVKLQPAMAEEVMTHVVEKGRFHVVGLLKMLLKKKKVGIVQQVLQEFERIYDEPFGTQLVLVSSKTKIGKMKCLGLQTVCSNSVGL